MPERTIWRDRQIEFGAAADRRPVPQDQFLRARKRETPQLPKTAVRASCQILVSAVINCRPVRIRTDLTRLARVRGGYGAKQVRVASPIPKRAVPL